VIALHGEIVNDRRTRFFIFQFGNAKKMQEKLMDFARKESPKNLNFLLKK
jgi:hypothetical protein